MSTRELSDGAKAVGCIAVILWVVAAVFMVRGVVKALRAAGVR